VQEKQRKQAYLAELQGNIDSKNKQKQLALDNKAKDATDRMLEQQKAESADKRERDTVLRKRNELSKMNQKQIEEYREQQAKQKADEKSFALELNKGAEEQERLSKLQGLQKQKKYATELRNEIENKKMLQVME
jgi:hypothetical protein